MSLYEKKSIGLQKEYKNNMGFYRHLHPNLELCFVLEGQVVCQVEQNEVVANTGDALLIFPYQIHEFPYEKNGQGRFALLNIPAELYKPYLPHITGRQPESPLIPQIASHPEIRSLLEIIIAAEANGIPYQMCMGFATGILGAVLQSTELKPRVAKQSDLLESVLDYCNQHCKEKLQLSDLAKQFFITPSALSRLLNQNLGVSFTDLIHSFRVEEATHLLKTTTLSMTDIAERVGFGNVRTMNRAFIKLRGGTPHTVRYKQGASS